VHDGHEQHGPASDQIRLIDAAFAQAEKAKSTAAWPASSTHARVVDEWQRWRAPSLPDDVPGYRIIGEIHRGGQGVVYQAVQESTDRTVAIKVMRAGAFAGPSEKLRFEREIQILARLKHPNIVTIHDSGVAGASAYFVMDYIDGDQLDVYLKERRPPIRDRLELFAKICEAVNVAHLRGVIHRDLKPGNIRVAGDGEPHVLDFGLAKQADWDRETSEADRAATLTGQFVGSLPWSSPEQAAGRGDEVDLRTDVYSLGVALYQALTGSFPYPVTGSLSETAGHIAGTEPINPRNHNADLDDEVTQIVLKALRKERDARYQTAGALGRDLRRYLAGEPIEAKRDSFTYIVRKQLARHRATVAVIGAFAATVMIGFVVSLTFWSQAVTAQHAEAQQKRVAQDNAELARARERTAAMEASKARAINGFLVEMLTTASPSKGARSDVTVREVVDTAAERVESGGLEDEPAVEAAVRHALGMTYGSLGLYEQGQHHLDQAETLYRTLGSDQTRERIKTQIERGALLRMRGKIDESEDLLNATMKEVRETFGPDDANVARCMQALCCVKRDRADLEAAETLCRDAVAIFRRSEDAPRSDLSNALNDLSLVYDNAGRLTEAYDTLSEAIDLSIAARGPAHYETVVLISNLGGILKRLGRYEEAEQRYREALDRTAAAVGKEHPNYATMLNALGSLMIQTKRYEEGVPVLEEAYRIRLKRFGDDHPSVAVTLNNLAMAHYQVGELRAAADSFRKAADVYAKARGADHPSVAAIKGNLAAVLRADGRYEEAAAILREVLTTQRATLGPEHERVAVSLGNLAATLRDLGQLEEAESSARESLRIRRAHLPEDHPNIADVSDKLAQILCDRGKLDEAESLCRRGLAVRIAKFGEDHYFVAQSLNTLGLIRAKAGAFEEAAGHLERAVAIANQKLPPGHRSTALMRADWARVLARLDRADEAVRHFGLAVESLLKNPGRDHPVTTKVVRDFLAYLDRTGRIEQATGWRDRIGAPD